MRIVAGLLADELGDVDDDAAGTRRRAEQLLHPRVVVGAVEDDDLRIGDLAHRARRGLEQMRVLVGIAHDADDGDPVAADLPGDVAVEILRRDDGESGVGGAGAGGGADGGEEGAAKRSVRFMAGSPVFREMEEAGIAK